MDLLTSRHRDVPKSREFNAGVHVLRRAGLKLSALVLIAAPLAPARICAIKKESFMFTILAFGLCAFVIETPQDRDGTTLLSEEYPAVCKP
jgi:hypothetical protein